MLERIEQIIHKLKVEPATARSAFFEKIALVHGAMKLPVPPDRIWDVIVTAFRRRAEVGGQPPPVA
ncbi:MAG: hypothetical protein IPH55_06590 [Betaproteobacteria bacterium]|nr:hypothetical protein [Betaproteobacteria bacterium]